MVVTPDAVIHSGGLSDIPLLRTDIVIGNRVPTCVPSGGSISFFMVVEIDVPSFTSVVMVFTPFLQSIILSTYNSCGTHNLMFVTYG